MSGNNDFDEIFGARPTPHGNQTFTERLGRPAASPPRRTMTDDGVAVRAYKSYGVMPTTTVTEICTIRSWVNGTDIPEEYTFHYRYLTGVNCIGGDTLHIFLIDRFIVVEGEGLAPLAEKLMRGTVTFLQQYLSERWPSRPVEETFIARIEVVCPALYKTRRP